ncbi:MAG TPA: D-alanyl-D-alanine carboxypeptidase, partial [Gemmatimonadales bacterium]
MRRRLSETLVVIALIGPLTGDTAVAQELTTVERAQVEDWFRRTTERTGGGEWGIAVGTMGGRVLWSVNPELELIPASTAKLFTVGFTRARAGGGARISTRVIGRGKLDSASGRWLGTWQLELGGDPTLERSGRAGPTLRELARQLHARGIRQIEGPVVLTSRTGPAASRYPAV